MKRIELCNEHSYYKEECDNMIIKGDNLEVLDILIKDYRGKIKCIYIDPPYNNGESYMHYDDKQHDNWLKDISIRLKKLEKLLSEDGSIWISIDDNEVHYLKVEADKIFNRKNFITTIIWQQRTTRENRKVFSNNHEYILVYAKNPKEFKKARNLLPPTEEMLSRYKNYDNDPRGPWQSVSVNVQAGHAVKSQFYEIIAPNGKKHNPPLGRCWIYNKEKMMNEIKSNNIWFGKDGNGVPRKKKFLDRNAFGATPETLWKAEEVGTNELAKKHHLKLFPKENIFDTPKPELLIKRIIEIATNEGDYVLDAYLGSGTTSAVAHKMNRKYIGIDQGEHIIKFATKRLNSIIDGNDNEGITKEVSWTGGGGYKFFQVIDK